MQSSKERPRADHPKTEKEIDAQRDGRRICYRDEMFCLQNAEEDNRKVQEEIKERCPPMHLREWEDDWGIEQHMETNRRPDTDTVTR